MTHWDVRHPKARKTHRCQMCHRQIKSGEVYKRGAGMGGGTAWTWRECAHCEALVRVAFRRWFDDEYDAGMLDEFEPNDIAEARVRAQYRRSWRRLDGTLYPIPHVIEREDRHGFVWPVAIQPGEAL